MEIPETDLVAISEREVMAAARKWADVSKVIGVDRLSPDEQELLAAVDLLEERERVRDQIETEAKKRDRLLALMP